MKPTSASLPADSIDLLILSNGPGEVMTWVRPVVKSLRRRFGDRARISVALSPCPHASGQEATVLEGFDEVDRVQGPRAFWPFLLWGKTQAQWNWHRRGVVLFLGGDQFFAVTIGKRLGYQVVTYAEWEARWLTLVDGCGVARESLRDRVPAHLRAKVLVVGDLIAEAQALGWETESISERLQLAPNTELVGLLPGSKAAKLLLGLPLGLAIAEYLRQVRPTVTLIVPVAPTLSLSDLSRYIHPQTNPYMDAVEGEQATLVTPDRGLPYLVTPGGARVLLWERSPAYDLLLHCRFCITTVGANTAELASLAVPMLMILPTQQLELMRAWDGIPGLLANLPLVGTSFTKFIGRRFLKRGLGLLAWPNIWAGREIVPEWVGHLLPKPIGNRIIDLLDHPEQLTTMRAELRQVRGEPGAAEKLTDLVEKVLK
jgi:hypothetical protein